MGRRTCTANTIITATQITNAPPAATAITLLRGPGSSDDETSRNSSKPLSSTAAMGSTAFRAQLMCRLRVTAGDAAVALPTVAWVVRIGVVALTQSPAVSCRILISYHLTSKLKKHGAGSWGQPLTQIRALQTWWSSCV